MLCCRRISATGTPASPCFRMLTIWLSVKRDFRMGISFAPERLPSNCLPDGEAYGWMRPELRLEHQMEGDRLVSRGLCAACCQRFRVSYRDGDRRPVPFYWGSQNRLERLLWPWLHHGRL